MSGREMFSRDEVLTMDPEDLTDQELEWAIEDSDTHVVWVQDNTRNLARESQNAGQQIAPLRQARNGFQQELDSRG